MAEQSYQALAIPADGRSDVHDSATDQEIRDQETWHNCPDYVAAHALNNEFFHGKRVGRNISQQYDQDQLNESGRQLLDHVFILKFHKPRFFRRIDNDGVCEIRNMGMCSYMLPNDSPLRLPLMEALLSSESLFTILTDLSLQSNNDSLIISNLERCEGLSQIRVADLIELLEEWSPDRDDFSGIVCEQLTEDVRHVKKSDCQAIIDTRPTVFLTMSDQYDHDVQKALLDLVNQSEKVLEDEKEVRIRSEELQRIQFASKLFDEYGHPEAKFDAHGNLCCDL
jgi:hypothetical protein